MCRICGRMVKCIFDSMPSRIHHVPSRRAFTTIHRLPTAPLVRQPPPSLTTAFSNLSLASTNPRPTLRSSLSPSHSTATVPPLASILSRRAFSSTPATLGYRRRMDTFSPSRRVQKRRHGYLARLKTKGGREVIKRRRLKKRSNVSW